MAALTCGTMASVFHSHPDARVFLVDYAAEPAIYQVKHPGGVATVELVNIRFSKRFYHRNNIAYLLCLALCLRLVPSRKRRINLSRRNSVLKAIQEADIIGSLAGGDSFSDIYGLRRLVYVVLPQILVQLLGKPLVLLPQTLGPFNGALAKFVARTIVRHSKAVFTRDPRGVEAIHELAGRAHRQAAFGHDMGFALEPGIRAERIPSSLTDGDRSVPLVGLNVSGLLYNGEYTRSNMFGIRADYRALVHDIIDNLIRKRTARVLLVPHVFGTGEDSESDVIACRKIFDEVDDSLKARLHIVDMDYDQHEMKALIGRCDFFIGSRMHACIAALSQCVPAVGLAYSGKFRGVFESVGMEELVTDIRECDEHAAAAAVAQAYQRRGELRATLEANIPSVRASVLELFDRPFSVAERGEARDRRGPRMASAHGGKGIGEITREDRGRY